MLNRDMLINGLLEGFLVVINVLKPYITNIILGGVLIAIIKYFVNKFIYTFSVVSGDTRRETKRKLKISNNIIDLFSALNDIWPKKK